MDGIFISDEHGHGTPNPVELDSNAVRTNALNGILIATEHELWRNNSGGTGDQTNGRREFDVAAGNFITTGRKSCQVVAQPP